MSNLMNTVRQSWLRESMTDILILPPSLGISTSLSKQVMPVHIREWLISLQQDSPASPSASIIHSQEKESKTKEICGLQPVNAFASYDLSTHSWRTSQTSLLINTYEPFTETWPKQGIMFDGVCWELMIVVLPIKEKDGGAWPTPLALDNKADCPAERKRDSPHMESEIKIRFGIKIEKKMPLDPCWMEYLIAWPIGWTELKPLATDRFQLWLHSHGRY